MNFGRKVNNFYLPLTLTDTFFCVIFFRAEGLKDKMQIYFASFWFYY